MRGSGVMQRICAAVILRISVATTNISIGERTRVMAATGRSISDAGRPTFDGGASTPDAWIAGVSPNRIAAAPVIAIEKIAKRVQGTADDGMMKARAHRASNHLRVPRIDRARQSNRGVGAERGRGSDNGAHIARILNRVENEKPQTPGCREALERVRWNLRNRKHSLW